MKNNTQGRKIGELLRILPASWGLFLLGVLIVYAVAAPAINARFGWKLPLLSSILATDPVSGNIANEPHDHINSDTGGSQPTELVEKNTPKSKERGEPEKGNNLDRSGPPQNSNPTSSGASQSNKENQEQSLSSKKTDRSDGATHFDDYLKKLPNNRFESPAGLIYGPGSEEGHRIKHIERHLADQPTRPGTHGVFNGTITDFLRAIDDAYTRAQRNEKGTNIKTDDGAKVIEASFEKSIGYAGGKDGNRKGKPKLTRLRIVVRGQNLITAFPF